VIIRDMAALSMLKVAQGVKGFLTRLR